MQKSTLSLQPLIFGEVLFDCFSADNRVLGGAPFNVAWHLQAFGDQPRFVSRIGHDELGENIISAMQHWNMSIDDIQRDKQHETGQVEINLVDGIPNYNIKPDCAYDFIDSADIKTSETPYLLYHGTLALRNPVSRNSLKNLSENPNNSIFIDVNLRSPWWEKSDVLNWLKIARWAKLNDEELDILFGNGKDLATTMRQVQEKYQLDMLLVTLGAKGAQCISKNQEIFTIDPKPLDKIVDTVGAGDAFTAVVLHGLLNDWSIEKSMKQAQTFAAQTIAHQGAIKNDMTFYQLPWL